MNAMTHIIEEIAAFQKELDNMQENDAAVPADRETFTLLLSGISTCRRMPGLQGHMGYEKLHHCTNPKDLRDAQEFLERMYGIHDRASLEEALIREYSECEQYEQFRTFWVGAPMFELEELLPEGRQWFVESREMAEQFRPLVRERGFYAWDINEKIGLCRKAVVFGIISEEEFREITDPYVRMAQVFYHSWKEYAVSCLCGAVYFMRREEAELEGFLKLNMDLVRQLFAEGMAWQRYAWYVPEEREWAELFDTSQECLITRKALEEERVEYMYRQEPEKDFSDCGWRFLTGDETEEYVSEPENILVCTYSDVCNIAPSVRAYFYADYGKQYEKTADGWQEMKE